MTVTVYVGKRADGTMAVGFEASGTRFTTTAFFDQDVRAFTDRYAGLFKRFGGLELSGRYGEFDGKDGRTQDLDQTTIDRIRALQATGVSGGYGQSSAGLGSVALDGGRGVRG